MAYFLATEEAKKFCFDRIRILTVSLMFANDALWADILGTTFNRKTLVNILLTLLQTMLATWAATLTR